MTLILTMQTKNSIWLLADRRLSARGRTPIDDATKVAVIETTDGLAIIGYAGLGATAFGSQPSQWVSNVLRGRNLPLETSLGVVADAMKREFIPHLRSIPDKGLRQHSFVVPAFHNGRHRVYSIDLADNDGDVRFRYTRHIIGGAPTPLQVTVPLVLAGSGAAVLAGDASWQRPLRRLVRAYENKKVTANAVADYLAALCQRAHRGTADGTVGPNCIVVWRNSKTSLHKGGGGHDCYEGLKRSGGLVLPSIGNGMDIAALAGIMMELVGKPMMEHMEKFGGDAGHPMPLPDNDEMNRRLRDLPSMPDERLR